MSNHLPASVAISVRVYILCHFMQCDAILNPIHSQNPWMHTRRMMNTSQTTPYLKYFDGTNGMGVTTASRIFLRTSTRTAVPFLWCPEAMYPMAMFLPSVGDGIPEVMIPAAQRGVPLDAATNCKSQAVASCCSLQHASSKGSGFRVREDKSRATYRSAAYPPRRRSTNPRARATQ